MVSRRVSEANRLRAEPRPVGRVGPGQLGARSRWLETKVGIAEAKMMATWSQGHRAWESEWKPHQQGAIWPSGQQGRAQGASGWGYTSHDCGDVHHRNRVCGSASNPKPSGRVAGVLAQVRLPAGPLTGRGKPLCRTFPQVRPGVLLQIKTKHNSTNQ